MKHAPNFSSRFSILAISVIACVLLLAMPNVAKAEFEVDISNTDIIIDTETGYMWERRSSGLYTYEEGLNYCNGLTLGAYEDWKMPDLIELSSIINYQQSFPAAYEVFEIQNYYYLSSTTPSNSPINQLAVYFPLGEITFVGKSNTFYVLCTRDGSL